MLIRLLALVLVTSAPVTALAASPETVPCVGLARCARLSNGTVDVVVTTEVGPRIVRYGFVGGDNVLGEQTPAPSVPAPKDKFVLWGGHRLWVAPEVKARSWAPDNDPVEVMATGPRSLRLVAPVEAATGLQKEIAVTLDASGTRVLVRNRVTNRGVWGVELAPWAITVLRPGGVAILPHEPHQTHAENLMPVRPLAFWAYDDLSDPRWGFGRRYLTLRTASDRAGPQKVGAGNRRGWVAYHRAGSLFVKRFGFEKDARYPDFGSNCELYTAGDFVEVESLGPLVTLEPGASTEHTEAWYLWKGVDLGSTEDAMDAAITKAIAATKAP